MAEQEIRQVLAMALENPDQGLAEIMEECRRSALETPQARARPALLERAGPFHPSASP